jgi:hypothetical protein
LRDNAAHDLRIRIDMSLEHGRIDYRIFLPNGNAHPKDT